MKKGKILATWILVLCMLGNLTISVLAAEPKAEVPTLGGSVFTEEFYNASDDTIVCYMEGLPIRKDQVNEYGLVDPSVFDIPTTRAVPSSNYVTIPNGYNEAIVKTTIASPRYSQNNILYYLQYLHGAQLASSIETGDIQALISLILCFVPNAQVPGFMIGLDSAYKAGVASDIRKRTDYGNAVRVNVASSSFGTFYGVFDWSGRQIETSKNYTDGTTETVNSIVYGKG